MTMEPRRGTPPLSLYRQVVMPEAHLRLGRVDLRGADDRARKEAVAELFRRNRAFDLSQAPLMRATLVDLGGEQLLLTIVHHLVSDGMSQRIIRRDLCAFYDSIITASEPKLPELPVHHPDFALWQHRTLHSSHSLEFWKALWPQAERGQIAYRDFSFCLPTASGRPPIPAYEEVRIEGDTVEDLKHRARVARVTLAHLFLAAFGLVLHRWTSRDIVSVWNNFANRTRAEVRDCTGWFANSHLVPIDFSGDPALTEVLERVRLAIRAAFERQEVPFRLLREALPNTPKFTDLNVAFDFIEKDRTPLTAAGSISMTSLPMAYLRQFHFPAGLGVLVAAGENVISLLAGYHQDRLPAVAIQRLLEQTLRGVFLLLQDPAAKASSVQLRP